MPVVLPCSLPVQGCRGRNRDNVTVALTITASLCPTSPLFLHILPPSSQTLHQLVKASRNSLPPLPFTTHQTQSLTLTHPHPPLPSLSHQLPALTITLLSPPCPFGHCFFLVTVVREIISFPGGTKLVVTYLSFRTGICSFYLLM